ncbi:MAG: hypothetical protein KDA65_15830 [Planctomycetaceae bacterium]|nr:hypothetical protein [Planctomycetaceae bacterium]
MIDTTHDQAPRPDGSSNPGTASIGSQSEAGLWADCVLLLIHLVGIGYLYWVMLIQVPRQVQLLEQFELSVSPFTLQVITLSQMFQTMKFSLVPLGCIFLLIFDFYLIRLTVGKRWRPLWVYGPPLIVIFVAGCVQYIMHQALQLAHPF